MVLLRRHAARLVLAALVSESIGPDEPGVVRTRSLSSVIPSSG
ncbi:hypothetical protein [Streptomyces sp. NPDC001743]